MHMLFTSWSTETDCRYLTTPGPHAQCENACCVRHTSACSGAIPGGELEKNCAVSPGVKADNSPVKGVAKQAANCCEVASWWEEAACSAFGKAPAKLGACLTGPYSCTLAVKNQEAGVRALVSSVSVPPDIVSPFVNIAAVIPVSSCQQCYQACRQAL